MGEATKATLRAAQPEVAKARRAAQKGSDRKVRHGDVAVFVEVRSAIAGHTRGGSTISSSTTGCSTRTLSTKASTGIDSDGDADASPEGVGIAWDYTVKNTFIDFGLDTMAKQAAAPNSRRTRSLPPECRLLRDDGESRPERAGDAAAQSSSLEMEPARRTPPAEALVSRPPPGYFTERLAQSNRGVPPGSWMVAPAAHLEYRMDCPPMMTVPVPVQPVVAVARSMSSREAGPGRPQEQSEGGAQLSAGSNRHQSGKCKPCAFFHTKGCASGPDCRFCHLCGDGEKKRRQRERLLQNKQRHGQMAA
mmetsp:Transcript_46776/g.138189  ORF Transcript_46776/g.138189 Transcript_46776/m.138189 type:complete len:306 (+) Transcript_46776:87-1004(+)